MKILSWNIYKNNRNIARAVEFLKQQDVDVICLQEFPARHLGLLKDMGLHMATCEEVLVHKDRRRPTSRAYSVIMSRFPLRNSAVVPHKKGYTDHHRKKDKYAYFRADSLYVDIHNSEGPFRIFNTHFKCMTGPYHRLSQFMEVTGALSHMHHNIICGDFNTFGKPWLNLFLWKWFGYQIQEIPINESKLLAEMLQIHGLKNPLESQVTFLKFPVQLDYILVPSYLSVKNKRAFMRLYGSDHFPLLLEI